MRGLLEVVTSQTLGGTRHVTPPTTLGLTRHSLVSVHSGSYAECVTPTSSIRSLARPPLQNRDATVAVMSRDVSGHVTHRYDVVDGGDVTEDADQSPVSPVCGPRRREQPLSKGSGLKRQVAPCSPHCSPPLARSTWDRKPRPVSPLHVQISPVTSRNQRRSLSPPSPTLQRLPKAPSPPRDCYRARAVPGEEEEEEDGEQSSESGSWGSSWEEEEEVEEEEEEEEEVVASTETARETEAGVQEPYHPDNGRVRLDECRVRLDECPVRLDECPVRMDEGRVRLDEVRVRLDEGRVRMDEGPVRPGEGPVIVQEGRVYLSDQHIDPTYLTPETVRKADAGAHERHHLDEGRIRMDQGCVRIDGGRVMLDQGRVRMDGCPLRPDEGPVVIQEGRVHLYDLPDRHADHTYLTLA